MRHEAGTEDPTVRREALWVNWYRVLTIGLSAGLFWAFLTINNLYPIPAWSLFSEPVGLFENEATTYRVLVGEFSDGTESPIRPIELTDALTGRIHTMVGYVISNRAFTIENPHSANLKLVDSLGRPASLPDGLRLPELLQAWGRIYRAKHSGGDGPELIALRLDERSWPTIEYADYNIPVRSWRELIRP